MGQLKFPFRLNRYVVSLLLLVLVLGMYAGYDRLRTQTQTQVASTHFEHTVLAPDAVQKQVVEAVGVLPGIDEVFVNQLADGTYYVHTTASIDGNNKDMQHADQTNDPQQAAKLVAVEFISKVYALPLHITAAEIYIQDNGRIIMGMGVGNIHKDLFASIPVNAGSDQTAQVIAALQKYQNDNIQHPDQLAWYEQVNAPTQ